MFLCLRTDDNDDNEDLIWLTSGTQPWKHVVDKWDRTSRMRFNKLKQVVLDEPVASASTSKRRKTAPKVKKVNLHEYIKLYPALGEADGWELVSLSS